MNPLSKDDLSKYEKTKNYLISMGVDDDVLSLLEKLSTKEKEEVVTLFSEIAEDEILQSIAILRKDLFQEYLAEQRSKLLQKRNDNVVPFVFPVKKE